MKNKAEKLYDVLRRKGIRLTYQRKEILSIFIKSQEHLKPEDVYDLVKDKGIGIATVYRTIEMLKESEIIKEITIAKTRYYELKMFGEKCMHIHFKCDICGTVYDCDNIKLGLKVIALRDYTETLYDVEVKDLTITMNGICKDCKR
ncbi:Fur family transcriptional regulator [Brassicibacter mesophilus]|jgi:Fur family transcriptional regulator, ferric uptake regulator|uniref:Fur family transcriptional regulator n=1 Tax=Brassicibacter mesophilus TaxID=745119 RepID=UPI003D25CDC4